MTTKQRAFIHMENRGGGAYSSGQKYLVIGEFAAPLSLYIYTWLLIGAALFVFACIHTITTPNVGEYFGQEWQYATENRFALWPAFGWWAASSFIIGAAVIVLNIIMAWAREIRKYL